MASSIIGTRLRVFAATAFGGNENEKAFASMLAGLNAIANPK